MNETIWIISLVVVIVAATIIYSLRMKPQAPKQWVTDDPTPTQVPENLCISFGMDAPPEDPPYDPRAYEQNTLEWIQERADADANTLVSLGGGIAVTKGEFEYIHAEAQQAGLSDVEYFQEWFANH